MQCQIVAVGRARPGPMKDLFDDYAKRLKPPIELREVEERRPLKGRELKAREGALLLDALPKGAHLVALDGRGKELSSEDLATRLGDWRDGGVRTTAFLVGGADGLDQAVLDRADFKLSLGAMTWPHMLVRIMLAEQLYRAESILSGHPYHRA